MKFKTTFILLAVFLVLLAAVLLFESKGKKAEAEKEKAGQLLDIASADVGKLTLKKEDETLSFEKDEKGDWLIVEPLQAEADGYEVDSLVNSFAALRFDRVVEETPGDLAVYEIPTKELTLWIKDREEPVRLLFGMENPLDKSLFAKRGDESRVVLLAGHLKASLDKKVFDFRKKDIFGFETADVRSVRLRAEGLRWEAVREGEDWTFTSPVKALAGRTRISGILSSLSGLRAKEFVSEDRNPEAVRACGLDKPDYEIVLSLPAENKDLVFSLNKNVEKFYAMSSDSNKIILFEGTLFDDLAKEVDELREKKVADFYSWEADKISILRGEFSLTAVKESPEGAAEWFLETDPREEADRSKVEAFIRKVADLEAAEFIDSPGDLAAFGLDRPDAEIRIRTKSGEDKVTETVLFVGAADAEKNQVVVKNAKYEYLFRVDSGFLRDLPENPGDWKVPPPEPPGDKKDGAP